MSQRSRQLVDLRVGEHSAELLAKARLSFAFQILVNDGIERGKRIVNVAEPLASFRADIGWEMRVRSCRLGEATSSGDQDGRRVQEFDSKSVEAIRWILHDTDCC